MKYPIELSFKILALASQIYIRDADGNLIGYVRQKLLKLKEDINVYADENQNQLRFNIKADRVLDFSARYNFTDNRGALLGSIKRQGMRSLWKARYDIFDSNENQIFQINEEKGWIKLIDAVAGEVPVLGMFTGYFFNPAYIIAKTDGAPVARMQKEPAFFEGKFRLSEIADLSEQNETIILLSVLTMTLLERGRG
jgi:uncharacterized protein YxjI